MRSFMIRYHLPWNVAPRSVGEKYIEVSITAETPAQAKLAVSLLGAATICGIFENVALEGDKL